MRSIISTVAESSTSKIFLAMLGSFPVTRRHAPTVRAVVAAARSPEPKLEAPGVAGVGFSQLARRAAARRSLRVSLKWAGRVEGMMELRRGVPEHAVGQTSVDRGRRLADWA